MLIEITSGVFGIAIVTAVIMNAKAIKDAVKTLESHIENNKNVHRLIGDKFGQIQDNINTLERELEHISLQHKQASKEKSVESEEDIKNFKRFLTPTGKIKKNYRHNSLAKECYKKFHRHNKS